jgi:centrosomal protein CEP104
MMKFLNDGLAHTSGGDVRQASEEVIIKLYRNVGGRVKDYLPPDSDKTRRNVLYKQLFVAFDNIDGKQKPVKVRVFGQACNNS